MIQRLILKLSSKITLIVLTNKHIGKSTFKIALAYIKFPTGEIGDNLLNDKSYFNISFYNTEFQRNSEGYTRNLTEMPFSSCNDTYLEYVEQELNDRISLNKYICPSNTDYYIQGDLNSQIFRDIEIFVTPWNENNNEGVICQPSEVLEDAINNGYINVAVIRSYFDFDDYENPVKTFLSESENHFMLENTTTWIEYFVQENTAMRSDNIIFNEPFK